jgi:hypothetical protein
MPTYGSVEAVKRLLSVSGTATAPEADERIADNLTTASALLEHKLGRTFAVPVADTTEVLWNVPWQQPSWSALDPGHIPGVLLLPRPARAVTGISIGGTVEGATITDPTVLGTDEWAIHLRRLDGLILAVRAGSGGWSAPVQITGDFADSGEDETVPADVVDVVNFLAAERVKIQNAGPAGFTGPDGAVVPIRNPWKDPTVLAVIDRYRIKRRRIAL